MCSVNTLLSLVSVLDKTTLCSFMSNSTTMLFILCQVWTGSVSQSDPLLAPHLQTLKSFHSFLAELLLCFASFSCCMTHIFVQWQMFWIQCSTSDGELSWRPASLSAVLNHSTKHHHHFKQGFTDGCVSFLMWWVSCYDSIFHPLSYWWWRAFDSESFMNLLIVL